MPRGETVGEVAGLLLCEDHLFLEEGKKRNPKARILMDLWSGATCGRNALLMAGPAP